MPGAPVTWRSVIIGRGKAKGRHLDRVDRVHGDVLEDARHGAGDQVGGGAGRRQRFVLVEFTHDADGSGVVATSTNSGGGDG